MKIEKFSSISFKIFKKIQKLNELLQLQAPIAKNPNYTILFIAYSYFILCIMIFKFKNKGIVSLSTFIL